MPVILALALALRIAVALSFWNVIFPDEIYQFLEQAHRLVFGQGVVPWEFQVGLRNWAIPLLLAAPMALAKVFTPNPLAGLVLIRVLLCCASLGIVVCAVKWGEQRQGRRGAWIAGLFTAFWPDLWLMAPHGLEEVLAADLLVPAVYLIGTKPRHVAATALLLGCAFTLRVQLAPAIAIAGIALCGRNPRHWLVALPVAALPVLAAGLLDWFTWGQPFRSFWLNIYLNVVLGVAAKQFGASSFTFFFYMLGLAWLWTLPVFLALAVRGARGLALPGLMALVIILTHCAISHKEFRFIYPAIALVVPLAGLGLAAITAELRMTRLRIALAAALLAGPLVSPWLWFMMNWQTNSYRVFEHLAATRLALVSVQGWDRSFLPMDIVFPAGMALTRQTGSDSNALVATLTTPGIPANFTRDRCYRTSWIPFSRHPKSDICVWTNPAPTAVTGTPPPFVFPFPPAAAPFKIRDRLIQTP